MDYAIGLLIFAWAKLIICFILMGIGGFCVIRPFAEWLIANDIRWPQATGCAAELIIGLITLLVGIYIGSW